MIKIVFIFHQKQKSTVNKIFITKCCIQFLKFRNLQSSIVSLKYDIKSPFRN